MRERLDPVRGLNDMSLFSRPRLRAFALGVTLAVAAPVHADSLEVRVAPELALDADQVKSVIAAELAASIVDGAADLGSVDLQIDGHGRLAVSHQRPDGTLLVRVVALPALPSDRLALIAFVTGNLVRDQLADLAAPDPSAVAPPPATVRQVVAPAAAEATPMLVQPEAAEVTIPVSIGLIPQLSTDRLFASRVRVRGAVNVIVGGSASIDGISISGVADLSASVRGLQIGGAATLARDTEGVQVAGAGAVARRLRGGQVAGAIAIAQDVVGLQVAGAATVARDVEGLQVAGAGAVARSVRGVQIAGAAAVANQVDGVQIAPFNIARRARGLQLGVVNVSDENDGAQIGVLNFVRKGRTDLDAWIETNGLGAVALRHGGRYMHNIYAVGMTPDSGDIPLVGLGLGTHHRLGSALLDLDAMAWQTHMFDDGIGLLAQARATLAIDLGPVAGFVAAAYNVSIEDAGVESPVRTALARTVDTNMTDIDVAIWPSLAVGVRGHLGATR
jgi:hypothetical protein